MCKTEHKSGHKHFPEIIGHLLRFKQHLDSVFFIRRKRISNPYLIENPALKHLKFSARTGCRAVFCTGDKIVYRHLRQKTSVPLGKHGQITVRLHSLIPKRTEVDRGWQRLCHIPRYTVGHIIYTTYNRCVYVRPSGIIHTLCGITEHHRIGLLQTVNLVSQTPVAQTSAVRAQLLKGVAKTITWHIWFYFGGNVFRRGMLHLIFFDNYNKL